jgi:hypothetical protein
MRPDPLQVMHVDVNGGIVTWKKVMITRTEESINNQNSSTTKRNQHMHESNIPMHLLDRRPCMMDKLFG